MRLQLLHGVGDLLELLLRRERRQCLGVQAKLLERVHLGAAAGSFTARVE
jgi:hypothetical protein